LSTEAGNQVWTIPLVSVQSDVVQNKNEMERIEKLVEKWGPDRALAELDRRAIKQDSLELS